MSVIDQIRQAISPISPTSLDTQVQSHLDAEFGDLESLLGHTPANHNSGPSKSQLPRRGAKRRRGLKEEIAFWESREREAALQVGLLVEGVLMIARRHVEALTGGTG
jgi:hypothetical protein